jgi:tetratricopeptide (TPR) repeat protein
MPALRTDPRDSAPARNRRAAMLVVILALAAASTTVPFSARSAFAAESGRCERLYTRGLDALHAGRGEEALALFQEAVAADPGDGSALYYRGLGFGRLGRYTEAATDLEQVVAKAPRIERARLELGYALLRLERYDEAAAQLDRAVAVPATAAEASLLLGIVETRRGNYDAAHASLSRALELDPSRVVGVRYYRALASYRDGDMDSATEDFTWVAENGGANPLAREASAFLERIRESDVPTIRLYAGSAFEYDSNVALAPDDEQLAEQVYGVSNRADGRAVLRGGARWSFYTSSRVHLSVAYDALQSLHFDLSEYDVQTHKATGQAAFFYGPATFGMTALYEYSFLDMESFVSGSALSPWVRVDQGSFGRAEVYYRARHRDFILDPFDPVRDSYNHAAGVRQFFSLRSPGREIFLGYRFDADIADGSIGDPYNYDGHQFEGGIAWPITSDLTADALYVYRMENYSSESFNRDDDEHLGMLRLEKRLSRLVWLSGSYVYQRNISDQKSFDYDRHIASLGLEVRY